MLVSQEVYEFKAGNLPTMFTTYNIAFRLISITTSGKMLRPISYLQHMECKHIISIDHHMDMSLSIQTFARQLLAFQTILVYFML